MSLEEIDFITLDRHSMLYNNTVDANVYAVGNYQSLWFAVILQAFIDLKNNSKKQGFKSLRSKASNWMNKYNEDFLLVCEMANLNPDCLIKRKNEIVKNSKINEPQHKKQYKTIHKTNQL